MDCGFKQMKYFRFNEWIKDEWKVLHIDSDALQKRQLLTEKEALKEHPYQELQLYR